ncbi:MAG: hypothetical protein NC094_09040 [Bacteroidales bacterium]|nr:hypothetical protein [Lachnoclostridium sp.]MCM1385149.1 hypothetical protein [Lachnoclostridium sp.]MCM1465551.1 hypothetical protein [Bacteroidales bacterium]
MLEEEREYMEAVDAFYEVFNALRKKYGLVMEGHFSIYPNDEDWLAVWRTEHGRRTEMLFRETGEDGAECYRKAAKDLRFWNSLKEEQEKEGRMAYVV